MPFWNSKKIPGCLAAGDFLCGFMRRRGSALLVDGGNAHAAAEAQGGQAALGLGTLLQLVQQGDDDTSTGSAHGVAQREPSSRWMVAMAATQGV